MNEETLRDGVIMLAGVLSVVLVIFASASAGRKFTDRDLLMLRGINGVRRIEITVKLRAQANRILLGLVFGIISIMTLADAPGEWRAWFFRASLLAVLMSFTVSAVLDWIDDRAQLRMVMQEEFRVAEKESHRGG
jgi:hypothetical protein